LEKIAPRTEERPAYEEMGGATINPKFLMKVTYDVSFSLSQLKVETSGTSVIRAHKKRSGYTSVAFVESAFATSPETVLELM